MTQEDKDLLLKDLCARLPYGVKVQSTFYCCDGTIWKCENETLTAGLLAYKIERYKPYLYPMSSMTEAQNLEYLSTCKGGNASTPTLASFDWLNKNHFDYRGLIEKGLALDATGLYIY